MKRALCALALCAACGDDNASMGGIEGNSHVAVYEPPYGGPPKLDLLFVLDDTVAMASYQDRMAMLPSVIEQAYLSIGDGLVDMHIGVTTDGTLRQAPGGGSYLAIRTEFDLSRPASFPGTLLDAVTPLVSVGTASSAPYQPLEAATRVLEDNPDGFMRDDHASIGIVIVSASDDASPGTPSEYADRIKATRADPNDIMITRIVANPSPRLDETAVGFTNRTWSTSLVDGDLIGALMPFAQAIRTILPGMCWQASDVDPETPGAQYDCTFTVTIRDEPRVLPPCKLPGDQFCWSLVPSNDGCSAQDVEPLKPEIPPYRFFWFVPPLRVECVVLE